MSISSPTRPWSARLLAAALLACSSAAPLLAQDSARPDHVFVKSKRDGSVSSVAGVVQKHELTKTVLLVAGKEQSFDSAQVQRVVWGSVPPSFREGLMYFERGAWSDAVARLRVAGGDANARELVKAAAKLMSAEALLRWGAEDPTRFTDALTEAQGFLSSYATHHDVPVARWLAAHATWLAGQPAEAGAQFKALYAELKGDVVSDGYSKLECLEAGVHAARALLEAKDTLGAREIFAALESQAGPLAAGAAADDPNRLALRVVVDEAALGSGFVDLAAGQSKQALTFFQNKVGALSADSSPALRYGALLGLGEALLGEGKLREAALTLAKVCALEPLDRDRAARATLQLAECLAKLSDGDARAQACARVKDVLARYGDTPAAARARALAKELGC